MEIADVKTLKIEKDDLVVIKLDAGNAPKHIVEDYAKKVMSEINPILTEKDAKSIILTMESDVQIARLLPNDRLIFKIDIGNMPRVQAEKYINALSIYWANTYPELDKGFWVGINKENNMEIKPMGDQEFEKEMNARGWFKK